MLLLSVPPIGAPGAGRLDRGIILRITLAVAAICVLLGPAAAAEAANLRGNIVATADALTLADLVEGVSGPAAGTALFRAPALGEAGTIQARRVVEAARALGVAVDAGGRMQVVVTRAARRVGPGEIEAAVKRALEAQHGLDPHRLGIAFEGAPTLLVAPDAAGEAIAEDLVVDRRSRRVSALVSVGNGAGGRQGSLRVTGSLVEMTGVAVLTRSVNRGDAIGTGDVVIERRPKEAVPGDARSDGLAVTGQVARRALGAGSVLRLGDAAPAEIVTRGDLVTVVYEIPGMTLTLRGRAQEAGALGDTIAVVNPQSKKVLQARIVAPGKVSVSAPLPGRLAAVGAQP
jgi:flagellar basal body P-ring formation protein FlgA